jgi:predicted nucleotidyltransferase
MVVKGMQTLDELLTADRKQLIFSCVAGSRAYGTQVQGSDEDIRGLYVVPSIAYLPLTQMPVQLADERGNTVYYSLRRCIELLAEANPNILELLFTPPDCVRHTSPEMEKLIRARSMFVTRQCGDTHIGYAMSQIKKARGQNKWVNNPKPAKAPYKEDFCFVLPKEDLIASGMPPCRPRPLKQVGWSLADYHAAKLEHVPDTYRLYRYESGARGVFRGDVLVCESIPERDEVSHFAGLLIFNEQSWKQALTEHQNYWGWRKNRNDARWEQQEAGQLDFDAKNMMHTIRLLMSGRSILERGEPIVRFEGQCLTLLMDIRAGKMSFDQIMNVANGLMSECDGLKLSANLPRKCDMAAADALLLELTKDWERRTTCGKQ